jgi:uncharacterized protein (TIGR02284 family)
MSRSNPNVSKGINQLIRVCYDSARGFLIASQSVSNRGLKALLRSYARQRFQFVSELKNEVDGRQDETVEGGTFLGGVHRGWIVIKTSMTLGPLNSEDVVITEVVRGEKYALDQYDRVLQSDLGEETSRLVANQRQQIERVYTLARRMKGRGNRRLVIRLYDRHEDVTWAKQQLAEAGFKAESMQEVAFRQIVAEEPAFEEFEEEEEVTADTLSAGALIGATVGLVLGFLAGIGVLFTPTMLTDSPLGPVETLVVSVAVGIFAGGFIGGLFGTLIGRDISERDSYLYAEGVTRDQTLLMVESDSRNARRAARIMKQVAAASAVPG